MKITFISGGIVIALVLVATAFAGERFHAWSYGVDTVPAGGIEIEHYATVETHHEGGDLVPEWEHQLELEYGITSSLEAGLYLVATQTGSGPLTFSAYKARLRYRFWPVGERAVDLAAYLEYIGSPSFDANAVEAKLIVAREGQKIHAALNVTGEFAWADGAFTPTLEPTLGIAWRIDPHFAAGIEGKLEASFVDPIEGPFLWTGPTLHVAGQGGRLWWTVSALFGLTSATRGDAEVEARSLLGINL